MMVFLGHRLRRARTGFQDETGIICGKTVLHVERIAFLLEIETKSTAIVLRERPPNYIIFLCECVCIRRWKGGGRGMYLCAVFV
jgi:hypothetical protein